MSILSSMEENQESIVSRIGDTIIDIISVPFDFTVDIVKTPFDFVGKTVSGISTKIVLLGIVAVAGIYIIGKSNILKDLGSLKP